jgi:hypothetical protein
VITHEQKTKNDYYNADNHINSVLNRKGIVSKELTCRIRDAQDRVRQFEKNPQLGGIRKNSKRSMRSK